MSPIEEKLLKALEVAESVMDICGGDAWERECSEDLRREFSQLRTEIDRHFQIGQFSSEAIAKKQKQEATLKQAEEGYRYWHADLFRCPYCRTFKRMSRTGLIDHLAVKHNTDMYPSLTGRKIGQRRKSHAARTLDKLLGLPHVTPPGEYSETEVLELRRNNRVW